MIGGIRESKLEEVIDIIRGILCVNVGCYCGFM
jgi:hypothetical protein